MKRTKCVALVIGWALSAPAVANHSVIVEIHIGSDTTVYSAIRQAFAKLDCGAAEIRPDNHGPDKLVLFNLSNCDQGRLERFARQMQANAFGGWHAFDILRHDV